MPPQPTAEHYDKDLGKLEEHPTGWRRPDPVTRPGAIAIEIAKPLKRPVGKPLDTDFRQYADGKEWTLVQGVHFNIGVAAARHTCYKAAKKLNMIIQSRLVGDDTLVVRFIAN